MAMRNGGLIAPRLGFDKAVALDRLVLGETALLVLVATAAVAGIIASGLGHAGRHRQGGEDASVVSRPVGRRHIPSAVLACDGDLAVMARAGRCGLCGGTLHSACYPRKPRGRPCRLGPEHDRRFSFCCAIDGCRSRATPPSLRFLGRKVYLAAIVVLGCARRVHAADRSRTSAGIAPRTLHR